MADAPFRRSTDPDPPPISVIVPNWNGSAYLFELMASLARSERETALETLLIDNHSSDGSAEMMECFYPRVRLWRNTLNEGFARAVNQALHQSRGEFIAILNNDVSWERDWLAAARQFLETHPAYDFAAPLVLQYLDPGTVDSAGDGLTVGLRPFKRGFGRPLSPPLNQDLDVAGCSCSAVLFRRDFFDQVGGFDPDFFMYYEDVDLFFRGFLRRKRGRLLAGSTVFHHEGGSIGRFEQSARRQGGREGKDYFLARNRVFFLVKNCPAGYAWLALPWLAAEFGRSAVRYLRRGQGLTFCLAHRDALRRLGPMLRKRAIIQKNRKTGPGRIWRELRRAGIS